GGPAPGPLDHGMARSGVPHWSVRRDNRRDNLAAFCKEHVPRPSPPITVGRNARGAWPKPGLRHPGRNGNQEGFMAWEDAAARLGTSALVARLKALESTMKKGQ